MSIFTGKITEGSHRASLLGFPTVNLPLPDESISGIYVGEVSALGKKYIAAIFADQKRKILEAHLLDFSENLYGKEVTIELFEKIRENKMFPDDALLQKAIAHDTAYVREYFEKTKPTS